MKTPVLRHLSPVQMALGSALALMLTFNCAQAEEPRPNKKPAAAPTQKKPEKEKKVTITGSRIPQKVDRLGPAPTTHWPVVIISMRSIERTGRVTPAGVLGTQPYVR